MALQESSTEDRSEMELERKWVERTFSKIKEGSLRGSIFTLANTALGVSVFLLPYMLREAGLVLGLLIVGLSAFINHLTVTIIAEVADATHTYNYQDLVTNELGRVCGKVLTVAVILYELGTITGFQVISKIQPVGELVPSIADSLTIRADKVMERDVSIAFVIVVIVIPLSFFRKLSKFRFLSLFAICALSYVMVLLVVEAPLFIKKESFGSIEYARGTGSIMQVITITLLAYFCHTNVPSIMGELRGTSIRRMRKISLRTSLLLLGLYGAVAFFGYISLLGDTPKVILMRNAGDVIDHDGAMVLGRVLITVMLIIAVPINLHPCRLACCQLVNRSQESLTPIAYFLGRYFILNVVILAITLAVAISLQNVLVVYNFTGGVCSATIMLLLPALLYPARHGWRSPLSLAISTALILLYGVGIASTIMTTVSAYD